LNAPTQEVALVPARRKLDPWLIFGRYGALALLVLLIVVFSILEPQHFPTLGNAVNILSQLTIGAIVAMGLTVPLVAGEFDLSLGFQTSFLCVLAAGLMNNLHTSPLAVLPLLLLIGAAIGAVNGLLVTRFHINSFVGTLGVGTLVVGLDYAYSHGRPIVVQDQAAILKITLTKFLGLPLPVWITIVVAIILWIFLNRTVFGLSIQATGGNSEAARLSGTRTNRVRVVSFIVAGLCCGLAGLLVASRTGSGSVDAGDGYSMSAFAAAFFGSAVLRDGQFHIIGTLVGIITVAIAFNFMALSGAPTFYQYLFQGALLIIGVGVGSVARRRSTR
jgi:ribose transport system permease protein